MKFSKHWLCEWVNPKVDTETLLQQLAMAGHEFDSCEPVAGEFSGVIVGEVVAAAQHPNADRLRVCKVNTGQEELQVVCGGKNIREGLKVPLATIGACLPNNFKIKRSKLRGEESQGMICSEVELGLAESSDGIMELSDSAPVGQNIRDYFSLDDCSIELDLTPNRGDCLSVMGIAREVAAINHKLIYPVPFTPIPPALETTFPVNVLESEACPRYVGRVIKNIDISAETPIWMLEKLRRSGIRSISPVVDVTNYVLFELGQPMHAFDLDKLQDRIEIRFAKTDDRLTLLNDQEVKLDPKTLVIADANGPLAIAGVMGGDHSGCNADTKNIFLESAFFSPVTLAGTARRYGVHTDSSHRFERGVDPELQVRAIERATELLIAIVGGEPGPVVDELSNEWVPKPKDIKLSRERVKKLLGLTLSDEVIKEILERLHFEVTDTSEGWHVVVPTYRFDITEEVDLIEEVVRLYGYNKIPLNYPQTPIADLSHKEDEISSDQMRERLVSRGYHEVMSYSFVDPAMQALLTHNSQVTPLTLSNPISPELSVMRTTLWAGLIQTYINNRNRQQPRARLFEVGLRFVPTSDGLRQDRVIAGLITDSVTPEQWSESSRPVDFYDLKADIESLLDLSGHVDPFIFQQAEHPALHPGQSSKLIYNEKEVGWLGALHPSILQKLDCTGSVYMFELLLEGINEAQLPAFQPISKFPSIRRDLALLVDDGVTAGSIQSVIRDVASNLMIDLQIFDLYKGKGIPEGKKSIAVALKLQHLDRTLLDDEINTEMDRIVEALQKQLEISLRE